MKHGHLYKGVVVSYSSRGGVDSIGRCECFLCVEVDGRQEVVAVIAKYTHTYLLVLGARAMRFSSLSHM